MKDMTLYDIQRKIEQSTNKYLNAVTDNMSILIGIKFVPPYKQTKDQPILLVKQGQI